MTDLHTAARQALEGPCELFQGNLSQGYGVIYNFQGTGKRKRAHVASWEAVNGPVPTGYLLDHLCRRRSCTNPKHLQLVAPIENVLRGNGPTAINARKTHCIHGHELAGSNVITNFRGNRICRTCQRRHEIAYQRKKRSTCVQEQGA